VHSEAVVPNEAGTGFDTITTDSGKLTSVDGSTLKIAEGTDKKKYKDVTIDVGSSPTVVRNREKATLSDLKEGDHVHVIQAPKGNFVMAEDDAFIAKEQKDHEKFGGRHGFRGGPGHGPGFGPPPPGAPADPPPPGQAPGGNENGSDSGSSSSGSNS
jgi:hypothetical protein